MTRALDRLADAVLWFGAACLVTMTSAISYQVVARYLFNASPAWSERLSLLLLGYLVFFGTAAGVHYGYHIRITALHDRLSAGPARRLEAIAHGLVAFSGLIVMLSGFQLTAGLWAFPIPALGLPRGIALLPVAIGGALILLFASAHLVRTLRAPPSEEPR